jgi:VWFA-related protein
MIRVAPCQRSDMRVDVTLVRVPFVAEDMNGKRIRDLRREELALTDNGAPAKVRYLWTELDRPLVLGLVIDISSSEMGFVRANREAVRRFINRVVGPSDQSVLATVDEQPRLIVDMTFFQTEVENGLDLLARQRRVGQLFGEVCQPPSLSARRGARACVGTAIWDGVFHLVRSKLVLPDGRKALLLLSDGLDLGASVHGLSSATEAAQSAGVTVYTIKHLSAAYLALSPITAAHALHDHGMEEIAVQTGGLEFTNPKHLDNVYAEIEEDLRSQYILAYSLSEPAASGKWHHLELRTTRPGVGIRVQAGFSAP